MAMSRSAAIRVTGTTGPVPARACQQTGAAAIYMRTRMRLVQGPPPPAGGAGTSAHSAWPIAIHDWHRPRMETRVGLGVASRGPFTMPAHELDVDNALIYILEGESKRRLSTYNTTC